MTVARDRYTAAEARGTGPMHIYRGAGHVTDTPAIDQARRRQTMELLFWDLNYVMFLGQFLAP